MENLDNKKVDAIQTELDFESSNKLADILNDINESYPTIKDIIKDRITYDGENYIINGVKMSEPELRTKMEQLNKYELDKSIRNENKQEKITPNDSIDDLYKIDPDEHWWQK